MRERTAARPASQLNKDTGKYEGFDFDVATEIAKRLGVDVAWKARGWDTITRPGTGAAAGTSRSGR